MLKLGMIQMANDNLDSAYATFTQVLDTRRKSIGHQQPEVSLILLYRTEGNICVPMWYSHTAVAFTDARFDISASRLPRFSISLGMFSTSLEVYWLHSS